jgi:hypothetical protein
MRKILTILQPSLIGQKSSIHHQSFVVITLPSLFTRTIQTNLHQNGEEKHNNIFSDESNE